jgi:EPS-associated MarR family transcriptional regulator
MNAWRLPVSDSPAEIFRDPAPDPAHYALLKLIEANPDISQRELARQMGVSLGKANYCLKALMEKGFVKLENFRNSSNKLAYAYLLTPAGLEEKARVTLAFLRRKEREYETIKDEISRLRVEVQSLDAAREGDDLNAPCR